MTEIKHMKVSMFDFFQSLNKKYTIKDIALSLNIRTGTINRWIELKSVPQHYYFDLCRMDNIEVDYKDFSEKQKDQFFTPKESAQYCINKMYEILEGKNINISKYHFIEPSAGNGGFYNLLPLNKKTGIDIEPRIDKIKKFDFLSWEPKTSNNICIGNPPFGLRGHLALKFINHAAKFSDFVCFILPQLFDSTGRRSCKGRVKNMNLIHSENISSDFVYPNGNDVNVNVIFQIWSKLHKNQEIKPDLNGIIKIYSLSDGGKPGSTRNKKHLYSCDYYLPSSCFGKDKVKLYSDFEDLPQRRGYGIVVLSNHKKISYIIENMNWENIFFKSTNGAYNLRIELIEKNIEQKIK